MLLVPSHKPFDYSQPPRLSLGLAALLLILFVWLSPQEHTERQNLSTQYQQQLLALEWPLYPTHVLQHQHVDVLNKLQAAYQQENYLELMQQIGFDRAFVQNIQNSGANYFDAQELAQWQGARQNFDAQRNKLMSQVLGLDPQRFRPITFFSYAFIDVSLHNVLTTTLLLLLVGMVVEWSMGSGALLSAWLIGSLSTGVVYYFSHLHGVTPLLGSTGALTSVLGLAFMHFRKAGSLTIIGTRTPLSGWLFLALCMLVIGLDFSSHHTVDVSILSAYLVSFISGMVVCIAYQRWFDTKNDSTPADDIEIEETPTNAIFQQELNQALQQIANFNFSLAKNTLYELAEKYPQEKQIHESLYHLCKFNPTELEFEELACGLFSLPNQSSNNHVVLRVYNDYKKRSRSFVALDTDTCLLLAMRFARINAFKEAEEIFKRALDSKKPSILFKKAALTLQQLFAAQQQDQRAHFYGQIASQHQD